MVFTRSIIMRKCSHYLPMHLPNYPKLQTSLTRSILQQSLLIQQLKQKKKTQFIKLQHSPITRSILLTHISSYLIIVKDVIPHLLQYCTSGHTDLSPATLQYWSPCSKCNSYLRASSAAVGPYFLQKSDVNFSSVAFDTSLCLIVAAHQML